MLLINNILAITNGQNYVSNHIGGTYGDGTRYHLRKLEYGTRLVIETPVLVEDTSDEGVLKAIDDGKLDIFPLTTYLGRNTVQELHKRLLEKQETDKKTAVFNAKVDELNARYPQVSEEVRVMVRYHDWYYAYSDSITVYRNGRSSENKILELLREVNAEGYFNEYSLLRNKR